MSWSDAWLDPRTGWMVSHYRTALLEDAFILYGQFISTRRFTELEDVETDYTYNT